MGLLSLAVELVLNLKPYLCNAFQHKISVWQLRKIEFLCGFTFWIFYLEIKASETHLHEIWAFLGWKWWSKTFISNGEQEIYIYKFIVYMQILIKLMLMSQSTIVMYEEGGRGMAVETFTEPKFHTLCGYRWNMSSIATAFFS